MDVLAGLAVIALCGLIAFALYMMMRGEPATEDPQTPPEQQGGHRRGPTILVPKFYIEQLSPDGREVIERFPVCDIGTQGISISRPDATKGTFKLAQQDCAYTVSEKHALIGLDEEGYFLVDNNSANHTYVQGNPNPVDEVNIEDGLVVYLGMQPLRFTFYRRTEVSWNDEESPRPRHTVLRRRRYSEHQ